MKYKLLHLFKSPWIGTLILTIAGIVLNMFILQLSFALMFIFGSAALLIILRLYGVAFAVPAMLLINLPTIQYQSYVQAFTLHSFEILFIALGFRYFRDSLLLKLDIWFWITIALPILYSIDALLYSGTINPKLLWILLINRLLNGIVNALIASTVVGFFLKRIPIGKYPVYSISMRTVIFKYLLALIMVSSILILFVNGKQQFRDMMLWGSTNLERSARMYIDHLQELRSDDPHIYELMKEYKQDFSVDSILLGQNNRVVESTLPADQVSRFVGDGKAYKQTLLLHYDNIQVYEQYPIVSEYLLQRWEDSSFVLHKSLNNGNKLILTLPFSYYLYPMYDFYLETMARMLIIVCIAAIIAQLIARTLAKPLQQLVEASSYVSGRLGGTERIRLPKSYIMEIRQLMRNFQSMIDTLEQQFVQIKHDKERLEIRVVERTFDLAESRAQKNAILRLAVDGIISTDSQLRITEMNPAAERMFQCDSQDAYGLPLSQLIQMNKTSSNRQSNTVLATRVDGSTFRVELTRSEILNEGRAMHTFFVHDLTEQEQAQEKYSEHERQVKQLTDRLMEEQVAVEEQKRITGNVLQTVQEGIVIGDTNGNTVFMNATMQVLFQVDDYTGRSVSELLKQIQAKLETDATSLYERLQRHVAGVEQWEQGSIVVSKNGSLLSVHMTSLADMNSHESQGFLLTFRDCTEERRMKQLQNELIAVVSHELRTPLSAIMGYIEMLSMYEDIPADKRREFMNTIQFEGSRLSRLLDDFLDSQRIDAGRVDYMMGRIQLVELLQVICFQWEIQQRDRLRLSVPEHEIYITGDHNRMIQVVSNLIGNALKYSPSTVPVDIRLVERQGQVMIEIEDYGIGISEQDQPRIFQKFFRSGAAEARRIGGTGLGLYIAQQIITAHHGKLTFVSEIGKGSTFTIQLPKADDPAAPQAHDTIPL
ncbi:sensor histidine kinase [Paenibacillus sp. SGZ-1009]|uniref:sensor histidine kinase n=1 Tax=Paenibacillus campi TaxID=3106031 RepID=UPI002AFEB9E3|nr:ATP-binding protein [Paenibacillus sp. SGZ-1009]